MALPTPTPAINLSNGDYRNAHDSSNSSPKSNDHSYFDVYGPDAKAEAVLKNESGNARSSLEIMTKYDKHILGDNNDDLCSLKSWLCYASYWFIVLFIWDVHMIYWACKKHILLQMMTSRFLLVIIICPLIGPFIFCLILYRFIRRKQHRPR